MASPAYNEAFNRTFKPVIDFSKVPKRALVDALRNANLGPSNLSQQSKTHLVSIARQALREWGTHDPARAAALREGIETETAHQRSR